MRVWIALAVLLVATAAVAADDPTPEETVTQYLTAFKSGDFNAAYPLVTTDMAQHKSREDWAKEQQWVMQMAEVKIFEFQVYPGKIEGEKAYVPNVLNSQDKFLNQLGKVFVVSRLLPYLSDLLPKGVPIDDDHVARP